MAKINQGILLITIDCGRKDSFYGHEVETPNIDRLRAEGITFDNAFSQSSTTLPSLYSLFLGQYVSSHGILSNSYYKVLGDNSLPSLLGKTGWDCRAFAGFELLYFTFGQDFQGNKLGIKGTRIKGWKRRMKKRLPPFLGAKIERSHFKSIRTPAQNLVRAALKYLKDAEGKVFLWLHFFDAHMEFYAPRKWMTRYYSPPSLLHNESVYQQLKETGVWFPENSFGSLLKVIQDPHFYPSLYKASLSHIDEQIGLLFDGMKGMGLDDRFFIILTSDHGENLSDHGMYCCHFKLFPTTTNVPLILKGPDFAQNELDELVQHIDLLPTLCETLNIELPPDIDGKSLLPLITQGKRVNEYVYSEHMRLLHKMVASKEWHYIFSDHQQKEWHGLMFEDRYLMTRETEDNRDLSNNFPEVCKEMENIAYETVRSIQAESEDRREGLEESLKALGYL